MIGFNGVEKIKCIFVGYEYAERKQCIKFLDIRMIPRYLKLSSQARNEFSLFGGVDELTRKITAEKEKTGKLHIVYCILDCYEFEKRDVGKDYPAISLKYRIHFDSATKEKFAIKIDSSMFDSINFEEEDVGGFKPIDKNLNIDLLGDKKLYVLKKKEKKNEEKASSKNKK